MPIDRLIVRAAVKLRQVFAVRAAHDAERALLERWAYCQHLLEQTRAAVRQAAAVGWSEATVRVRRTLLGVLKAVRIAVNQTSQGLPQPWPARGIWCPRRTAGVPPAVRRQ